MRNLSKLICVFVFLCSDFIVYAAPIPQQYEYANSHEVKIAYRLFGKGTPLIIINGGPGRSSDTFTELAEKLSSTSRQVILFDQRGTGKSQLKSANEKTISLELMVEDLENLRKHLGYDKISLLGHSFGGMYAMAYAAKYPENIKALILSASGSINLEHMKQVEINTQAKLTKEALKKYKFWTSSEQKKRNAVRAKLEALRVTAPIYVYQQKFVSLIKKNLTNLEFYNPEVNQLVWKSMGLNKYDLTGAFAKFKAPTLIIDGEQDFLGKSIPSEIHQNFPNSRLEILSECSHYPWLDKPKEYFALIDGFLSK